MGQQTYTAQFIEDLKTIRADIFQMVKLDEMAYSQLIYDTGCAFIDAFSLQFVAHRQIVRDNMLTNKEWGYWEWWKGKWALDDALIIRDGSKTFDIVLPVPGITPFVQYQVFKEAMIDCPKLQKECYFLIKDKID